MMFNVVRRYVRFTWGILSVLFVVGLVVTALVLRPSMNTQVTEVQEEQVSAENRTEEAAQVSVEKRTVQESAQINLEQGESISAAPAQQTAPAPEPFDPLSSEEQRRAETIAYSDPTVTSLLAGSSRYRTLLVERHEESKDRYLNGTWTRLADVFIYNYIDNRLIHGIVNLRDGRMSSVEAVSSVQFPFTRAETTEAFNIALADPTAGSLIRQKFREVTGREFLQSSDIESHAFTYNAALIPSAPSSTLSCGQRRCGEMMLLVAGSGEVLPVSIIVDLSVAAVVFSSSN